MDAKEKGASLLDLLKGAFKEFGEDKASRLGAALAYYAIFSIGPLLVILISVVGLVYGESAAKGEIAKQISSVVGNDGASMIQTMIAGSSKGATGIVGTIIGTLTLILGAIGIFMQLKDALNTVWETKPEKGGIMLALKNNVMSFIVLILMGVLLIAMLVVTAVLATMRGFLDQTVQIPGGAILWQIINYAVMFGLLVLVFAILYKMLPDAQITWKDVWFGAIVTAILFGLGQVLLGIYFNFASVGSAFGAAGSLVVVLVWIYYSAQIMLFGAEITQVYARKRGSLFEREQETARDERTRRGGRLVPARSSPWFR